MINKKTTIAIVNSSSFGISFPEHLKKLEEFANLIRVDIPKRAEASLFHEKLAEADGIIASVTPVYTREVLMGLPKLQLLARHGVGCDNVDLDACTELGITVSKVGGHIERESVAQMAVGLMNDASRKIVLGNSMVRNGDWAKRAHIPLGVDFYGATVGLVGLGSIGKTVARIMGKGFGANVISYDPYVDEGLMKKHGVVKVSFDELLARSDFISLHCPLTDETSRMFAAPQFEAMKPGAIFINTCRGEILNQSDLIDALESGKLGFYATDVVEGEPIGANHVLLSAKNVIVTPHLGGYSVVSLRGMGNTMVEDMQQIFVNKGFPGVLANDRLDLNESRIARFRKVS